MFIKFDVYYLNIESRKDITMEYEKQLRESGEYTEMQIQEKLSKRELLQYKVNYALDKIPKFLDYKDRIIYDLIHGTANDCNSSTYREEITLHQCGYENSSGKLGEDGIVPGSKRLVEVKPQNATDREKLGGGGSFSDLTHEKLKNIQTLIFLWLSVVL